MVLPLEGNGNDDFSGVALRTKKGFAIIRKELKDMKHSLGLMRDYLSRQKKDYGFYKKDLDERNVEFKRESEEFSSKLVKIKVLLSEFNTLRREIVIQRDLGKIETRIKVSCKKELIASRKENKKLRERLDSVFSRLEALENGEILREYPRGWAWNRGKEKKKHSVLEILEEDEKGEMYADEGEIEKMNVVAEGGARKFGEKRVWTAEELKAEVSDEGKVKNASKRSSKKAKKKKIARKKKKVVRKRK